MGGWKGSSSQRAKRLKVLDRMKEKQRIWTGLPGIVTKSCMSTVRLATGVQLLSLARADPKGNRFASLKQVTDETIATFLDSELDGVDDSTILSPRRSQTTRLLRDMLDRAAEAGWSRVDLSVVFAKQRQDRLDYQKPRKTRAVSSCR